MKLTETGKSVVTPFRYIFGFAVGGCAYQILFNAMWAFALLYYTQVLGLDYVLAGLALSITTFWDAVSDPLMGHISDNTRSRYGRRHPYILVGGIAMAIFFFLLWTKPDFCAGKWGIFAYLLGINFLFRTALTVFFVPYNALGYEVCTDYDGRSLLQSTAAVVGMLVNLVAIALGWRLFFPERGDLDGTQFASNYFNMGLTFSIVALVVVAFSLLATRRYASDTRSDEHIEGNTLRAFYADFRDILFDKRAIVVFLFFGVAQLGNVLFACWQAYVWVYFMKFSGWEKTFCHGIGMVFFVLGATSCVYLSKKLDKKPTICIGAGLAVFSSAMLILIFCTGLLGPGVLWEIPDNVALIGGKTVSISLLVFSLFQAIYWMSAGVMGPISVSMIADLSEINKCQTGVLKDGSYSAIFNFIVKMVGTLGLLLQGISLKLIGFKEGSQDQSAPAIDLLVLAMLVSGIVFALGALLIALKYPVDRHFMMKIKETLRARESQNAGDEEKIS